MASAEMVGKVRRMFLQAFGKDLNEGGGDLWFHLFYEVPDDIMGRAASRLVETRQKSGLVVPGEMAAQIEAVGGHVHKLQNSAQFERDPVVRALRSRSQAEDTETPITMTEWLESEGIGSFAEAMRKYGDRESPTDRTNALVSMEPPRTEPWRWPLGDSPKLSRRPA